jgi:hypothetical protein
MRDDPEVIKGEGKPNEEKGESRLMTARTGVSRE